jgi:hypothetical protein
VKRRSALVHRPHLPRDLRGASGAIAGVLGAYLILFPRGQVKVLMGRGVVPMPGADRHWVMDRLTVYQRGWRNHAVCRTGGVAYMAQHRRLRRRARSHFPFWRSEDGSNSVISLEVLLVRTFCSRKRFGVGKD